MSGPTIHTPSRSDDFLNADWWTAAALRAAFVGSVELSRERLARAAEFRQQAERASGLGGLAGPDAALPAIGGIGVAGQLPCTLQVSRG